MENSLRKEAADFGNKIFNIDDEYVLHICSTCYKPFEIYKPKRWTDATYYINAWSEDGTHWQFMDTCGTYAGSMESSSLSSVADRLWLLNRHRHYVLQPSQWCCGQNSFATDFKRLPADTIADIFNLKKEIECSKPSLVDQIQSASTRATELQQGAHTPEKPAKEPDPEI